MAIQKQPDIYVCDRCGHETTDSSDRRGGEEQSTRVKWSGSKGGMSYAGDWGGINYEGDAWLCMDCSRAFEDFMKEAKK